MNQNGELKNNISKERLDLCLSAGNLAWWEMDVKTGNVIFNENKVKMLGYTMKEFTNVDYTAFTELVHPDDHDKTMKAMKDHLEGKITREEVKNLIKLHTNQFAKRQMTWFQKDKKINWVENRTQAERLIKDFLN